MTSLEPTHIPARSGDDYLRLMYGALMVEKARAAYVARLTAAMREGRGSPAIAACLRRMRGS